MPRTPLNSSDSWDHRSVAAAALIPTVALVALTSQRRQEARTSQLGPSAQRGHLLCGADASSTGRWKFRMQRIIGHSTKAVQAETIAMTAKASSDEAEVSQIKFEHIVSRPPPGASAPAKVSFAPNGAVTYLFSADGGLRQELFVLDAATGTSSPLCQPPQDGADEKDFTLEEKLRRERARELFTGITSYSWAEDGDTLLVPIGKELFTQSGVGGALKKLFDPAVLALAGETPGPILDARLSTDGSTVAFVYDSEVYVVPSSGGKPQQITKGARGTSASHGLADFIAQEEMNRYEGYWISPDSSMVAFEEVDESHIPVYRIMHQGSDAVGSSAQEDHHYPFAGAANPKVKLGITRIDDDSGKVTWLDLENIMQSSDVYLARVSWNPDGSLMAQIQNREQTLLKLVRFDPATGKANVILTEESDVWLNLHDMFRPLQKTPHFLWASERTGFQHLFLYDNGGCLLRQLTDGDWMVESIKAVDEEQGVVYFVGNKGSWMDRHLFRVKLEGGDVQQITQEPGMHAVVVDAAHGYYVDTHHSAASPMCVEWRNLSDGALIKRIYKNDDQRIKDLNLQPPEFFTLPSSDSKVTLQACVWKPDPTVCGPGPYPTAVSVYGGPHVQKVSNSWGVTADMRAQFLRSKGYLVLSVDNRGSSRRGLAFEGAIKHDMGNLEVADQVAAVQHCVKLGLTDPTRVGIYGWSYGGYMSAMALAKEPEIFHAAISGAPVTHWDGYDTHYTERYMGTPQSNPNGYKDSAVMAHVSKMQGKLLLVHGLLDENVHFRHTARLINELIKENKQYELLLFPNERHTPRGVKDRVYMEEHLFNFFQRTLRS